MSYEILSKLLLVTSVVTLGSILFKDYWFKENEYKKQTLGLVGGFTGIFLLFYPNFPANSLLYLGILWTILSPLSLLGGYISSLIGGVILLGFRFISTPSFEEAIISILIIAFCTIIGRLPFSLLKKWIFLNVSCFITFFIYSKSISPPLYLFIIICILLSSYIYILLNIIRKNYHLFFHLKTQATQDFLTGINNTRQFHLKFSKAFSSVSKENAKLSLIMLDIDYFKHINDTYGHPAGDKILKQFASILKNNCSPQNVFRIGGEEFCILLFNSSMSKTYDMAEKIRIAVQENPFDIDIGPPVNITVSIGISVYPDTAKNKGDLIKSADDALYKAKKFGRNRVNLPLKIYNTKEPAS